MTPGAVFDLSVICPSWLHGDSHLLEQKQALGQNATWKQLNFAQQFIEMLLTANAQYSVENFDESFLLVPKHVTYKLKQLYHLLKRRSGQVQGSARFGQSLCLDQNTAVASQWSEI